MQVIERLNEEAAEQFLGHPMLVWKKTKDPNTSYKKRWTKKLYCQDERFRQEIPVLQVPHDLPSITLKQMEEILCVAANLCGFVSLTNDEKFKKAHSGRAMKKDIWNWSVKVAACEPHVLELLDKVVRRRSRSV
jgi:hypothetical protein